MRAASIAQDGRDQEAVDALNTLREMGFSVIINGLAYSFREEPFTFMHTIIRQSMYDKEHWLQMQLTTKCVFCDRPAKGSMRLTDPGHNQRYQVAGFDDYAFLAGDSYVPSCCVAHESCSNKPAGFTRPQIFN